MRDLVTHGNLDNVAWVWGVGFRVQGSGFRVQGSGFGVYGSRAKGPWFRVEG